MPVLDRSLSNWFAILLAAVVLSFLIWDARANIYRILTGRGITLICVLLWYLLEAVRVPKELNSFTQTEYNIGILCVGLSTLAFLMGYHYSRSKVFDGLSRRLVAIDGERTLWLLFLGGAAIGLAPMLYYADFDVTVLFDGMFGMQKRWSWALERGRYGDLRAALLELQMFLRAVVPIAAVLLFSRQASGYKRLVCGFFLAWMILRANASGMRSAVVPILLPMAAAAFWKAGAEGRKWLIIVGVPLSLVLGYFYSAFIVANRNQGTADFHKALVAAQEYTGFEMFRELLFIMREVPDDVPYQYGRSYLNQVINPVPRYFWPGKPIWDAGILLARAKGMIGSNGDVFMTNSPGFVGEAYLNFGFAGLIAIPFGAGWFVRAWDRLLIFSDRSFLVFAVFAGGLGNILASGRSISISTFYGMIALCILLMIIDTLDRRKAVTLGAAKRQSHPRVPV